MPLGTIGLATFRWNSVYKSWLLIALFPLISFWLFWWQVYLVNLFITERYLSFSDRVLSTATDQFVYGWGGLAFGAGMLAWLWYSWRNHGAIIRGLCLSRPVTGLEEPKLYALLESVCISQGLPTPELEILDTPARNSFVCHIDEETNRIYVTRGLLETLQADEIEAVFAHEIAHILQGDTRLLSFSIAFCDMYPFIIRSARPPRLDESANEVGDTVNPIMFLHPVIFLLLMPVWGGYILTSTLRVLLFINRELEADAAAVEITKNPDALMRALLRINRRSLLPFAPHDIRFLCIDNPRGGVFATHPRISMRLRTLQRVTGHAVPSIEPSEPAPLDKRFRNPALLKRVFKTRDPHAKTFNAPWK